MDPRFLVFVGVAALLVISPGPTIAVITESTLGSGRRAALWTVLGIAIANSTLALGAGLGLSVLVGRVSWMLGAVTIGGAVYLGYLGVRSLLRAVGRRGQDAGRGDARRRPATLKRRPTTGGASSPRAVQPAAREASAVVRGPAGVHTDAHVRLSSIGKGVTTNLLNPSVALFYMTLVPQFIGPRDRFAPWFALLCATHIVMAAAWHVIYAWSLGTLAERLRRPAVRRAMDAATGLVLLGFGLRFVGRL